MRNPQRLHGPLHPLSPPWSDSATLELRENTFFGITGLRFSRPLAFAGCNPQKCGQTFVDISRGGGPGRDADPHGSVALPYRAAAQAGAVVLDAINYAICGFGITE